MSATSYRPECRNCRWIGARFPKPFTAYQCPMCLSMDVSCLEFPPPAPRRIQLSRGAGWRMPENTVRVSRPSAWGNPFRVVRGTVNGVKIWHVQTRDECLFFDARAKAQTFAVKCFKHAIEAGGVGLADEIREDLVS